MHGSILPRWGAACCAPTRRDQTRDSGCGRSFGAEGAQRVDLGGAAGREVAGGESSGSEHRRHAQEGCGIVGRYAEEETLDRAGEGEGGGYTDDYANEGEAHALTEDHA